MNSFMRILSASALTLLSGCANKADTTIATHPDQEVSVAEKLSDDLRLEIYLFYSETIRVAKLAANNQRPYAPADQERYALDLAKAAYLVNGLTLAQIIVEGDSLRWVEALRTDGAIIDAISLYTWADVHNHSPSIEDIQKTVRVRIPPHTIPENIACLEAARPGAEECGRELARLGAPSLQPIIRALVAVDSIDDIDAEFFDFFSTAGLAIGLMAEHSQIARNTVAELVGLLEAGTTRSVYTESCSVAGIEFGPDDARFDLMTRKVSWLLLHIAEQPAGQQALRPHLKALEDIYPWAEFETRQFGYRSWGFRNAMSGILNQIRDHDSPGQAGDR